MLKGLTLQLFCFGINDKKGVVVILRVKMELGTVWRTAEEKTGEAICLRRRNRAPLASIFGYL